MLFFFISIGSKWYWSNEYKSASRRFFFCCPLDIDNNNILLNIFAKILIVYKIVIRWKVVPTCGGIIYTHSSDHTYM